MFANPARNYEKALICPKCGSGTEKFFLSKTRVHRCQMGCGIWINQADLETSSNSRLERTAGTADDVVPTHRPSRFPQAWLKVIGR